MTLPEFCLIERERGREAMKGHVLKEIVLTTGTVNASLISNREIFIEVLKSEAVGMVILHNHPSGDPTPSEQDEAITALINEGAKLLRRNTDTAHISRQVYLCCFRI